MNCGFCAECFAASTEALAETYARQVLNEKSEIFGGDEVVGARGMVVRALDGLRARKRMRS